MGWMITFSVDDLFDMVHMCGKLEALILHHVTFFHRSPRLMKNWVDETEWLFQLSQKNFRENQ